MYLFTCKINTENKEDLKFIETLFFLTVIFSIVFATSILK